MTSDWEAYTLWMINEGQSSGLYPPYSRDPHVDLHLIPVPSMLSDQIHIDIDPRVCAIWIKGSGKAVYNKNLSLCWSHTHLKYSAAFPSLDIGWYTKIRTTSQGASFNQVDALIILVMVFLIQNWKPEPTTTMTFSLELRICNETIRNWLWYFYIFYIHFVVLWEFIYVFITDVCLLVTGVDSAFECNWLTLQVQCSANILMLHMPL